MGNYRQAVCGCGYERSVRVGGNRATYHEDSSFPFFCEQCGMVDVNVAKPELSCPLCSSPEIVQYGNNPASQPWEGFPHLQCDKFKAHSQGNLCPQCRQYTLVFKSPDFFFD